MPLRITKATDPIEVKTITACIYAGPGRGKSTLGFTAAKPLLLDFDHGAYRAGKRGDSVQIESWADVSTMTADDLKPFSTLVVDTAGRALDALSATIITENPKMGRGGSLTLQGFGELKSRFTGWLKFVRQLGLDVVLISHSDEKQNGDEMIERLDIQGGSKNEIYKVADSMGRLYIEGGKRVLNFNPTDTAFGKNPAQLPPLEVPHYSQSPTFLGDVITRIKSELNRQSEDQAKASSMLADWKAKIDEAKTAEDFTTLLPTTKEADPLVRENVQRMFAAAAKAKGYKWDKKAGAFASTEQKAA
jgi:hypothetical protein